MLPRPIKYSPIFKFRFFCNNSALCSAWNCHSWKIFFVLFTKIRMRQLEIGKHRTSLTLLELVHSQTHQPIRTEATDCQIMSLFYNQVKPFFNRWWPPKLLHFQIYCSVKFQLLRFLLKSFLFRKNDRTICLQMGRILVHFRLIKNYPLLKAVHHPIFTSHSDVELEVRLKKTAGFVFLIASAIVLYKTLTT